MYEYVNEITNSEKKYIWTFQQKHTVIFHPISNFTLCFFSSDDSSWALISTVFFFFLMNILIFRIYIFNIFCVLNIIPIIHFKYMLHLYYTHFIIISLYFDSLFNHCQLHCIIQEIYPLIFNLIFSSLLSHYFVLILKFRINVIFLWAAHKDSF